MFQKINYIIAVVICLALIAVAFGLHPLFGVATLAILGSAMWIGYTAIFSPNASHTIEKESVLTSSIIDQKLAEITKTANDGVLAALTPNGTNFYISDSDRACVIGPPGTGKTTFLVNQIKHWIYCNTSV